MSYIRKQFTFINVLQAFCILLFVSCSLTVINWFNASSSYTIASFTSNFVYKIKNILENEPVVKKVLVEELVALKKVIIIKEKNVNNRLYKACTTLISVTFSSNVT